MLTVLHEVNFGLQKLATFSQSEQCYAVLKHLFQSNSYLQIENDEQWFELLVLLIALNYLKNLEEPKWKKYSRPLQSCWKNLEWMDIGVKSQTVSTCIPRRKIYPLICCNIFLVIIKCCYGNMNRHWHAFTEHVLQLRNPPLKSFLENEV